MIIINFKESGKRFVLSLHYNGSTSFLLMQWKYINLCLGNTWKDFILNNMKKKTVLKESVKVFSVGYNARYP